MKLRQSIQLLPIDSLNEYEGNAKKHDEKQIKVLVEGIKRFGFNVPILVDQNKEIIAGHGRLLAARKLNLKEVPCILIDDLTDEEVQAFRLADNQINAMTGFDMSAVVEQLKFLDSKSFDIDLTGFDRDLIITTDEKDDEIPENPPARAKLGDIWQLGGHRVMCGDSTKKEDVERLMDRKKADMVFTDPPYNVDYSGRGKETNNKIENDNLTESAFREFLEKSFNNLREFLKPEGGVYVCYASRTHREFEDSLNKANFTVRNQIIWVKLVASMGWGDYRWKHEPIFYCQQKDEAINFYGDRKQYTEWREEKSDNELLKFIKKHLERLENGNSTIWRFGREFNYKHPTQKPIQLILKAIFNSSKRDDIILDLFLGSGSTLIASEKTGRICYGMELDERYCDVIIKRWEDYTGQKAIKVV